MTAEQHSGVDDPAAPYFNCTHAQRAVFEAGIKLGGLFHQFTGIPLSASNAAAVENAIRESVAVQPYVDVVEVHIDRSRLHEKAGEYDYTTLSGDMLDVRLTIRYDTVSVRCALRYVEELSYPLMYVESVVTAER